MGYVVEQAVKTLEADGFNPEVIDLISLKPFDMETIGNSIKKTHRCVIVEECMRTGGIGASLSAVINENLMDELDAPVVRLSSQMCPRRMRGHSKTSPSCRRSPSIKQCGTSSEKKLPS